MKRSKKTYITFTIQHESQSKEFKLSTQSIKHEIQSNLTLLFGQFAYLRMSKEFNILYYNTMTNYGIIQEILCCIVVIRNLAKHNVRVDVIHIGRTLKKCKWILVNNYLDSLEKGVIYQKICGTPAGDCVDSAIETLKSISLLPH